MKTDGQQSLTNYIQIIFSVVYHLKRYFPLPPLPAPPSIDQFTLAWVFPQVTPSVKWKSCLWIIIFFKVPLKTNLL